jgi:hypothetical protein
MSGHLMRPGQDSLWSSCRLLASGFWLVSGCQLLASLDRAALSGEVIESQQPKTSSKQPDYCDHTSTRSPDEVFV